MIRRIDAIEARLIALFRESKIQDDAVRFWRCDLLLHGNSINFKAKGGRSTSLVATIAFELNGIWHLFVITYSKGNFGGVEGLLLSEDFAAVAATTSDFSAEVEKFSAPGKGGRAMNNIKSVVESTRNSDCDHARERIFDDAALHENMILHDNVVRLLREERGGCQP
jgi:hypothetical protein